LTGFADCRARSYSSFRLVPFPGQELFQRDAEHHRGRVGMRIDALLDDVGHV